MVYISVDVTVRDSAATFRWNYGEKRTTGAEVSPESSVL